MRSSIAILILACVVLAGCSQLASPVSELAATPTPEPESETAPSPTTESSATQPTGGTQTRTTRDTKTRTRTATTTATTTQTPTATALPTVTATTAPTTVPLPTTTLVRTPALPPTATATPTATTTQTANPMSESTRLTIAEIDAENETITFRNVGERPLDLDGYVVTFDDGQRYTFPRYVLEPGATVTLHTGRGDSAGSELFAGFFYPVINDFGDTILVLTPDGEIVLTRQVQ